MNIITPIIENMQLTIKPEDIKSIKNQVEKSVNSIESLKPLIEMIKEIKPEDIERIKSKFSDLVNMKYEIEKGIHTLQPILALFQPETVDPKADIEKETSITETVDPKADTEQETSITETVDPKADTEQETSINELTDTENNRFVDYTLDQQIEKNNA